MQMTMRIFEEYPEHLNNGGKGFLVRSEKEGDLIVPLGPWSDAMTEAVRVQKICRAYLTEYAGFPTADLNRVSQLRDITSVSFNMPNAEAKMLYAFEHLTELVLGDPISELIDFSRWPNLKFLWLMWEESGKSIRSLRHLQHLTIRAFTGKHAKVEYLSGLAPLHTLEIAAGPGVKSIEFLHEQPQLRHLETAYLSSITDFSVVGTLSELEHVGFTSCKRMGNINWVKNLPKLKFIALDGCGTLPSLAPLLDCPLLESVFVFDPTIIEDNDLRILLQLPKLNQLAFSPHRGYNMHPDELRGRYGYPA